MITSTSNGRVKLVRALQSRRKNREEERRFVLEGIRLIDDALRAGAAFDWAFFTPEHGPEDDNLIARLKAAGVLCIEVSEEVMASMADTETPQGVLAVVPFPDFAPPSPTTSALILDALADPGNAGTLLRTAAAAGIDTVLFAPGTVDLFNPKVVRAAMGAHFRVAALASDWAQIREIAAPLRVHVADAGGALTYTKADWREPFALIIGSEAHGPGPESHAFADEVVSVPLARGVESLNAALAAGVILFEARRQRENF
jgi:TrmH family RNA methyltransferase